MYRVCEIAALYGQESIARLRDAILFKHNLNVDLRHNFKMTMQDRTNIPNWGLTYK